MRKIIALLLSLCLLLSGCAGKGTSADLTADISAKDISNVNLKEYGPLISDFALRLLQSSWEEEKNILISPLSVITALSMTANGAEEETLRQMEEVLGSDIASLNGYLGAYPKLLNDQIHMANALWIKDTPTLTIEDCFLQTNADYYGAGAFRAPFDNSTLADINNWVEEQTDGQITDMLDKIPEDAVMYLVNALAFEAEWEEIYESYQVWDGRFTMENGEVKTVPKMRSIEHAYLELNNATGFLKYYDGRRYAFAALLPEEGITVSELVRSLDAQTLHEALTKPQEITVHAAIPKFETEYSSELSEVLKEMGMPDAFDSRVSNFSGMGSTNDGTNLCIGRVLHKTRITVAEEGTKAGAATIVEMLAEGAAEIQEEIRIVTLDRPFLYMIVDTELMEPVFIGVMAVPAD